MRFLILFMLMLNISITAQVVNKVLISGIAGYEEHDESVKNAFLIGYSSYNGTQFNGEIDLYPYNLDESFQYAADSNYQMIIRSTTGLNTGIYYANQNPDIKLVMPAGSNSFVQTYSGDIEECPVIVTGAGDTKNVTGYNIDFYSIDPITTENYSSFSNGYIAGQIAYISNSLNCTIEEAREKARLNGSENGNWDTYNGYGEIDVYGTISSALPVELTSFTSKLLDGNVVLNWTTATEVNNYGFEIERSSLAATPVETWETIGFVEGHGNSNSSNNYTFIDKDVAVAGESLNYRLKQIDFDGGFEYSDIVTINIKPNKIKLFQNHPNPFNPSTQITFTISEAAPVQIIIYNVLGEKVTELVNKDMEAGLHSINFMGNNLTSGTYFYRLTTPKYSKTMKMIFEK